MADSLLQNTLLPPELPNEDSLSIEIAAELENASSNDELKPIDAFNTRRRMIIGDKIDKLAPVLETTPNATNVEKNGIELTQMPYNRHHKTDRLPETILEHWLSMYSSHSYDKLQSSPEQLKQLLFHQLSTSDYDALDAIVDELMASTLSSLSPLKQSSSSHASLPGPQTAPQSKPIQLLRENWSSIIFYSIYALLCACFSVMYILKMYYSPFYPVLHGWILLAKACAGVIYINLALVFLPTCHTCISWLQSHKQLRNILPLNSFFQLHKISGWVMMIAGCIHTFAHLAGTFRILANTSCEATNNAPFCGYSWLGFIFTSIPGITGVVLILCFAIIIITSLPSIRQHYFGFFFRTHHIFLVITAAICVHGVGHFVQTPHAWRYVIGGFALYIIDCILRVFSRHHMPMYVKRCKVLDFNLSNAIFNAQHANNNDNNGPNGGPGRTKTLAHDTTEFHHLIMKVLNGEHIDPNVFVSNRYEDNNGQSGPVSNDIFSEQTKCRPFDPKTMESYIILEVSLIPTSQSQYESSNEHPNTAIFTSTTTTANPNPSDKNVNNHVESKETGTQSPSYLIQLETQRPSVYRFKAGQYAKVVIPEISQLAHPFTIASSPYTPNTLVFVIKVAGNWTQRLREIILTEVISIETSQQQQKQQQQQHEYYRQRQFQSFHKATPWLYTPQQFSIRVTNALGAPVTGIQSVLKHAGTDRREVHASQKNGVESHKGQQAQSHGGDALDRIKFSVENSGKIDHIVALAGGVGITPFSSVFHFIAQSLHVISPDAFWSETSVTKLPANEDVMVANCINNNHKNEQHHDFNNNNNAVKNKVPNSDNNCNNNTPDNNVNNIPNTPVSSSTYSNDDVVSNITPKTSFLVHQSSELGHAGFPSRYLSVFYDTLQYSTSNPNLSSSLQSIQLPPPPSFFSTSSGKQSNNHQRADESNNNTLHYQLLLSLMFPASSFNFSSSSSDFLVMQHPIIQRLLLQQQRYHQQTRVPPNNGHESHKAAAAPASISSGFALDGTVGANSPLQPTEVLETQRKPQPLPLTIRRSQEEIDNESLMQAVMHTVTEYPRASALYEQLLRNEPTGRASVEFLGFRGTATATEAATTSELSPPDQQHQIGSTSILQSPSSLLKEGSRSQQASNDEMDMPNQNGSTHQHTDGCDVSSEIGTQYTATMQQVTSFGQEVFWVPSITAAATTTTTAGVQSGNLLNHQGGCDENPPLGGTMEESPLVIYSTKHSPLGNRHSRRYDEQRQFNAKTNQHLDVPAIISQNDYETPRGAIGAFGGDNIANKTVRNSPLFYSKRWSDGQRVGSNNEDNINNDDDSFCRESFDGVCSNDSNQTIVIGPYCNRFTREERHIAQQQLQPQHKTAGIQSQQGKNGKKRKPTHNTVDNSGDFEEFGQVCNRYNQFCGILVNDDDNISHDRQGSQQQWVPRKNAALMDNMHNARDGNDIGRHTPTARASAYITQYNSSPRKIRANRKSEEQHQPPPQQQQQQQQQHSMKGSYVQFNTSAGLIGVDANPSQKSFDHQQRQQQQYPQQQHPQQKQHMELQRLAQDMKDIIINDPSSGDEIKMWQKATAAASSHKSSLSPPQIMIPKLPLESKLSHEHIVQLQQQQDPYLIPTTATSLTSLSDHNSFIMGKVAGGSMNDDGYDGSFHGSLQQKVGIQFQVNFSQLIPFLSPYLVSLAQRAYFAHTFRPFFSHLWCSKVQSWAAASALSQAMAGFTQNTFVLPLPIVIPTSAPVLSTRPSLDLIWALRSLHQVAMLHFLFQALVIASWLSMQNTLERYETVVQTLHHSGVLGGSQQHQQYRGGGGNPPQQQLHTTSLLHRIDSRSKSIYCNTNSTTATTTTTTTATATTASTTKTRNRGQSQTHETGTEVSVHVHGERVSSSDVAPIPMGSSYKQYFQHQGPTFASSSSFAHQQDQSHHPRGSTTAYSVVYLNNRPYPIKNIMLSRLPQSLQWLQPFLLLFQVRVTLFISDTNLSILASNPMHTLKLLFPTAIRLHQGQYGQYDVHGNDGYYQYMMNDNHQINTNGLQQNNFTTRGGENNTTFVGNDHDGGIGITKQYGVSSVDKVIQWQHDSWGLIPDVHCLSVAQHLFEYSKRVAAVFPFLDPASLLLLHGQWLVQQKAEKAMKKNTKGAKKTTSRDDITTSSAAGMLLNEQEELRQYMPSFGSWNIQFCRPNTTMIKDMLQSVPSTTQNIIQQANDWQRQTYQEKPWQITTVKNIRTFCCCLPPVQEVLLRANRQIDGAVVTHKPPYSEQVIQTDVFQGQTAPERLNDEDENCPCFAHEEQYHSSVTGIQTHGRNITQQHNVVEMLCSIVHESEIF